MNDRIYLIDEFSKIVGIPKSTLYYYDKIGLLNKKRDQNNNYRIFNESDFTIVQNIISLKTIGFELKDIKKIINKKMNENDLQKNIINQMNLINEQIQGLIILHDSLSQSLKDISNKSYDSIVFSISEIIRNYNMYNDIKKSWLKEILSPSVLNYVAKKPQLSAEDENKIIISWNQIIDEINNLIKNKIEPKSNKGLIYAEKWMNVVKSMGNTDEDQKFGMEVWSAYKNGLIEKFQNQFPDQKYFVHIPKNVIEWVDQAVGYMYEKKYNLK